MVTNDFFDNDSFSITDIHKQRDSDVYVTLKNVVKTFIRKIYLPTGEALLTTTVYLSPKKTSLNLKLFFKLSMYHSQTLL